MEMKNNYSRVEHILYNMFTENTGIHLLDSGATDGRHWQQNQKLKIDDFVNREMVTYNKEYDYHSIDTFQFLYNALNVDNDTDELNKLFDEFINRDENKDECYLTNIYDFLSELLQKDYDKIDNTYNFNETLTQDFQFGIFEYNNNEYVILQIHNGADVRGGYTKPYIFKLYDEYSILPYDEEYLRDEHKEYKKDCLCVGVEE
jgi:hypothetical protein